MAWTVTGFFVQGVYHSIFYIHRVSHMVYKYETDVQIADRDVEKTVGIVVCRSRDTCLGHWRECLGPSPKEDRMPVESIMTEPIKVTGRMVS
jgi:hypothetical protein